MEINVAKQFKSGLRAGLSTSRPEIIGDITKKIPLPSNSVDLIYSRHTLEHLTYPELMNHLHECNRVLKPGGIIRMVVPELDSMVADWQARVYEQPEETNPDLPVENYTDFFIYRLLYHDHYYLHNFDTLSRALVKTGFAHARTCQPGETAVQRASAVLKEAEINRSGDLIVEADRGGEPLVQRTREKVGLNPVNGILTHLLNLKIVRASARRPTIFQPSWLVEKFQRRSRTPVDAADCL